MPDALAADLVEAADSAGGLQQFEAVAGRLADDAFPEVVVEPVQVGGGIGDGVACVGFQQQCRRTATHVEVHQQHLGAGLTRQLDAEMRGDRGGADAAFHGQETDDFGFDELDLDELRHAAMARHRVLQYAHERLAAGLALDQVVLGAAFDRGEGLVLIGRSGVNDDRQAMGVALDGLECGQALGVG